MFDLIDPPSKKILLLSSLALLICFAVFNGLDRSTHHEAPSAQSENAPQHESAQGSSAHRKGLSAQSENLPRVRSEPAFPAGAGPVAGDGSDRDGVDRSAAAETPGRLLPSQVVGRVFPPVDLERLASRLPPEHKRVFERTRLDFPAVDWTEIEPTQLSFLAKRAEFPLNLNDQQREAYAAWLREVEPMSRALIQLRAEAHGLSASGMEGNQGFYIDGFREGVPVYVVTSNVGAAETTGASYLRRNSGFDPVLGATIDGGESYVSVVDMGTIYEHTEFQLPNGAGSRILVKEVDDTRGRDHMTHVAGTIAAWGYNPNLEGMAPRSWIRALIQQNASHVTNYAMATPGQKLVKPGQEMGVTNPRTGNPQLRSVVGNSSLGTPRPNIGYNSTSANYDNIMRDHPYYMHFNSSGNRGGDYGDGFGTLTGSWKVAKNMIVIGATSAVTRDADGVYTGGGDIASFSSRGPTYDGRISPDFVAKGESVTSTTGTTGSRSYDGTSMSSPNAAGSVALLMDYVRQSLPQQYLRSSTYRALLATTADDRGNPGPDYTYGWGILNIHAAAKIVRAQAEDPLQQLIVEDSLAPGQTWTGSYASNGTQAIRVTIAWLDPASENTSPCIVNVNKLS